ncbi:undecaprenyl-diphosphate phosphatase [bacterium]|nr:undecaprenyl-diphosphate phosphatase [bacterium]
MGTLELIILGIVQGLSEFLPISSSAHIVFVSNIYQALTGAAVDIESSQQAFASIMLHFGTLVAILIYFRKELIDIIKSFCIALYKKNFDDKNARMGFYIIIGTIFTVAIAYPLKDITEKLLIYPQIVAFLLIITGFMLFFSEFKSKHLIQTHNELDIKKAIIIGIAQGLAVFPGFSRSGWTIATGLFTGLDRVTSTKYSFLLVLPIILGTSIFYPILEIKPAEIATYNLFGIAIGTLVSAIVGYFCIKYFLKFVERFSLNFFANYCIVIGLIVISFFAGIQVGLS